MLLLIVFYYIAGFVHLAFSSPWHLNEISPTHSYQISCTMALLQKYFQSGEALSGSVIMMSFTSASAIIQQELLNAMHAQDVVPWTIVVRQPSRFSAQSAQPTTILHEKPQCYFIVIENLEDGDLEDAYEDFKSNINWNPIAQFVVFLNTVEETDEDMNDLMIDIMLSLMNKKVYNVNVIGRHKGYQFYCAKTVFPYHRDNNCGSRVIEIETLDICNYEVDKLESEDDGDDGDGEEKWNGEDKLEDGDGDRNGDRNEDRDGEEYELEDRDGDGDELEEGDRHGARNGDRDGEGDELEDGDRHESRNRGDELDEGDGDRDGDRDVGSHGGRNGDRGRGDELEDGDGYRHGDKNGDGDELEEGDGDRDGDRDVGSHGGKDRGKDGDRSDAEEDELEDGDGDWNGDRDGDMDGDRDGARGGGRDGSKNGDKDGYRDRYWDGQRNVERYGHREGGRDGDRDGNRNVDRNVDRSGGGDELENGDGNKDGDRNGDGYELEDGNVDRNGGKDGDRGEDRNGNRVGSGGRDSDGDWGGDRDGDKNGDKDGDNNGDKNGDKDADIDGGRYGGKNGCRDRDGNGDRNRDGDRNGDSDVDTSGDRDGDGDELKYRDGESDGGSERDSNEFKDEDRDENGNGDGDGVGNKDEDRSGEGDFYKNGDRGNKINRSAIIDKSNYEDELRSEDEEKGKVAQKKNSNEDCHKPEHGGVVKECRAERRKVQKGVKKENAKKSKINQKLKLGRVGSTHIPITPKLGADLRTARRWRRNSFPTHIQLQELRRGLFADKVPKDLSGCPILAAYRSWEPYIFTEHTTNEVNHKAEEKPIEHKATDQRKDESKNYIYEYVYSAMDDESYTDTESHTYRDSVYSIHSVESVSVGDGDESTMKLNGIEYQLIKTIGELLHVSIDLQVENGNQYLLFQKLVDGDVEMIFGGIDEDPSISQYVSSAIPYHQDDLTWCVAKAKREYSFYNIFQSFHVSTWLLTVAVIVIASLIIVMIQKLQNLRLHQFDGVFATVECIYGIVLGQSVFIWRVPNSMRIVLFCTCFFSVIFVNFYQSFLVSTLTTPISSYQISHLEELYRNRMTVMGSVESTRHLNKEGEIFKYIRENFQICYNIEQCLNHAATNERIAVAVSRQYSHFNPRIKRDHLYCFDRNENIYIYLVTMLLPKKYHLLHKINPIIQHVIESGHMEKWACELDMKHKIRNEIHQAQREAVKGLTIDQIVGSFALHGLILVGAFVTFLVECWTHWMVVRRRTRLRFIRLLHYKFF